MSHVDYAETTIARIISPGPYAPPHEEWRQRRLAEEQLRQTAEVADLLVEIRDLLKGISSDTGRAVPL